jgi:hypothetical protein
MTSRSSGFSLVEALVICVLMTGVFGALVQMFTSSLREHERHQKRISGQLAAELIIARLRSDLRTFRECVNVTEHTLHFRMGATSDPCEVMYSFDSRERSIRREERKSEGIISQSDFGSRGLILSVRFSLDEGRITNGLEWPAHILFLMHTIKGGNPSPVLPQGDSSPKERFALMTQFFLPPRTHHISGGLAL